MRKFMELILNYVEKSKNILVQFTIILVQFFATRGIFTFFCFGHFAADCPKILIFDTHTSLTVFYVFLRLPEFLATRWRTHTNFPVFWLPYCFSSGVFSANRWGKSATNSRKLWYLTKNKNQI